MKYEFDVQMDEKALYDFILFHNYKMGSGIIWIVFGIFALGLAIFSGGTTPITYRLIYGLFGLLFVFYIPWDLKKKVQRQLKSNEVYAKPIHYVLDEEGIHSFQDEKEATVVWKNFRKIKVSKKSVIIYMKNKNACIFPKEIFGADLEKAVAWITSKVGH